MKGIRKVRGFICLLLMCLMTTSVLAEEVVPIVLKVGLQDQVGGSLTVTENAAGMFQKGDLYLKVVGQEAGIYLEDVTVETTGGLKGVTTKVTEDKNGKVKVTLSRSSREAASITLKDFNFTVDRTVPEGTYDLELSGSAIASVKDDKLVIKDFIKISTPHTSEDNMGIAVGTSSFTLDQTIYKSNNRSVEMDAAPYIEGKGYIMVPIRYVAQAFGIEEKNILFGQGQITIFAGSRMLVLNVGSSEATINGAKVALETPVKNVNGRIYVPAGDLAKLLGVKCKWDADTKTAYFSYE